MRVNIHMLITCDAAGLRGEVDWGRPLPALPVLPRPPLQGGAGHRLLAGPRLLREGQKLLHRLGARRAWGAGVSCGVTGVTLGTRVMSFLAVTPATA